MRVGTVLWRGLRLVCPVCGGGKLFRGWFRMHRSCSECRLVFERGPGYWLGSIYVNYGLTALLVTVWYLVLWFTGAASPEALLVILIAFAVVFPLWFFRYARSLWLGFDHLVDPAQESVDREPRDRSDGGRG